MPEISKAKDHIDYTIDFYNHMYASPKPVKKKAIKKTYPVNHPVKKSYFAQFDHIDEDIWVPGVGVDRRLAQKPAPKISDIDKENREGRVRELMDNFLI